MTTNFSASRRWRALTLCLAVVSWPAWPAPAAEAVAAGDSVWLAPHRAVYDVSLAEARDGENIAAIQGRMVFEFVGSVCDGYTLNIRLVTQMVDQSGDTVMTDLRTSNWEHGSGRRFRFNSSEYQNDQLVESMSGSAARENGGEGIVVDLNKPEASRIRYSGEILFPTQHSLEILSAAREERRLVQARIFDGSDQGRRLYATTAFIGKRKPPESPDGANGDIAKLARLASWPVTISYFDAEAPDESVPAYEMTFRLFANGVSRDVMIDYGEFAIQGALKSLEFFPPSGCD